MRLLSLSVHNYRILRETTVEFDPSRTLIGGPNETGKSTLVEALHRVLFLKAKVTGDLQKEMESDRHDGVPAVRLTFEKDGHVWKVYKEFKGNSGITELIQNQGSQWRNDAAEEQLARLFGIEPPKKFSKNWLNTQWPHLWVWQGSSGEDPSKVAAEQRDTLVSRLQKEGLGAVMQSNFDQRVRERIKRMREEWFTEKDGRTKAGSKLYDAKMRLAETKERLTKAEETMSKLEAAVNRIISAESAKADAKRLLPGFQADLKLVEENLGRVNELNTLRSQQVLELKEADSRLEVLLEEQRSYEELKAHLQQSETMIKPLVETKEKLETELQNVRKKLADQHQHFRQAELEVRKTRQVVDAAQALVQYLGKQQNVEQLQTRVTDLQKTRAEWKKVVGQIASQPKVGENDLVRLRGLEAALNLAIAKRDSMAAALQLMAVEEGVKVQVNGQALAGGEKLLLTEDTVIQVGTGTRLQLRPGGGGSVEEAKREVELAQSRWRDALAEMAVADLEQATRIVASVADLKLNEQRLQVKLELLGVDTLEKTLENEEQELKAAESDWQRRCQWLESQHPAPTNLEAARQWLEEERCALEKKEQREQLARRVWEESQQIEKNLDQQWQQESAKYVEQKGRLSELRVKLQVLEENSQDAATRKQLLEQATTARLKADANLQQTLRQLEALQPELLKRDQERLNRSISIQRETLQQMDLQMAEAQGLLRSDGSEDPHAALLQARASYAAAVEVEKQESRRGEAIKRLHELFTISHREINHKVVEPLAKRMTDYLGCVFGSNAKLTVEMDDKDAMKLKVHRGDTGDFWFESLSGGAKEQVAAAARLAMAEILAEIEPDQCLPMVFDDAFAYTDPQRVLQLQRMLDLAANRGLQVVVFTCNPADYAALGAKEIRLDAAV